MTPMTRDVPAICARLSPTMKHVLLRCSEAERWERDGRTFPRWWSDLVAGMKRTSMQTIRALEARGLIYEDEHDNGYGLTSLGVATWIFLHSSAHILKEQQAMMPQLPPFVCEVVHVHDEDGPLWCRSGRRSASLASRRRTSRMPPLSPPGCAPSCLYLR
ncbi:hypothetical protein MOP88_13595 [Sphingomonas sp. WKB10]|nr:hypothetical protein [Sphingomonas sp. WKB10]